MPLEWDRHLESDLAQPLLLAGCVAAAAAVAAASSVGAAAAAAPAAARSLMLLPGLCTDGDSQRDIMYLPRQQKQHRQLLSLVGVSRDVSLATADAAACAFGVPAVALSESPAAGVFSVAAVEQQQQQQQQHDQEDPEQQQPLLLPGSTRGEGQQRGKQQEKDENYMSWKEVWHVFGIAALPMVGFGLMDQLIMIRLGDVRHITKRMHASMHAFARGWVDLGPLKLGR